MCGGRENWQSEENTERVAWAFNEHVRGQASRQETVALGRDLCVCWARQA